MKTAEEMMKIRRATPLYFQSNFATDSIIITLHSYYKSHQSYCSPSIESCGIMSNCQRQFLSRHRSSVTQLSIMLGQSLSLLWFLISSSLHYVSSSTYTRLDTRVSIYSVTLSFLFPGNFLLSHCKVSKVWELYSDWNGVLWKGNRDTFHFNVNSTKMLDWYQKQARWDDLTKE